MSGHCPAPRLTKARWASEGEIKEMCGSYISGLMRTCVRFSMASCVPSGHFKERIESKNANKMIVKGT